MVPKQSPDLQNNFLLSSTLMEYILFLIIIIFLYVFFGEFRISEDAVYSTIKNMH